MIEPEKNLQHLYHGNFQYKVALFFPTETRPFHNARTVKT